MENVRPILLTLLLLAAAGASSTAAAAGDAERGAVLAATCMGCHGIPGYRNAYPSYRVPKLAGQHADYLVIGMNGYKNKARTHQTMQAQVANLSAQDIQDVAAYFAARAEPESGTPRAGERVARGKEKATVCAACHGANGISAMATWPTLAGQHEDYLRQALTQYKLGERTDPVMAGQVNDLSENDIADLAAYFAAQPGLVSID